MGNDLQELKNGNYIILKERYYKLQNLCYNLAGDKMKKIILSLCLILLSACSSTSPQTNDDVTKFDQTFTEIGFDTFISFIAYTKDQESFDRYAKIVEEEFIKYDHFYDKYKDYKDMNNIKTINDYAGIKPIKVDPAIIDMLLTAKKYTTITDSQFDITLGAVTSLWHDHREANNNTIPSQKELEEAKKYTSWQFIEINEQEQTVFINDKRASLDVGSIAKGYATEQVALHLEKLGLSIGILNAGGNVRLIGQKPDHSPWVVGIQMPDLKSNMTHSLVEVSINQSQSFVTSGDYQRFYMYDGKIMHHIIDPKTLQPSQYAHSVTVITKNSGIADILSTALFNMNYEDGLALIKMLKETEKIEVDVVWVFDKDRAPKQAQEKDSFYIIATDGIKESINFDV